MLAKGSAAYLALLPLVTGLAVPVENAVASAADALLAVLLCLGVVTLVGSPGFRGRAVRALDAGWRAVRHPRSAASLGRYAVAVALLLAFSAWTAASATWGFHPGYALLKGAGYAALSLGLAVVSWSGLQWDRAVDAWLVGTGALLVLSLLLVVLGSLGAAAGVSWGSAVAEGMLHRGGSVEGLPLPRLRGLFFHPNALGDYLVVSAALLWGRWPVWVRRAPLGARAGAALLAVALAWTFSSAWVAAGVLLLLWGRSVAPAGAPALRAGALVRSFALRAAGGLLAAVSFAALVFPLRVGTDSVGVISSGIRTPIWTDAVRAFVTDPVRGVGAAPFLADAVDAMSPAAGPQLWDAHSLYLSVLGQFGLVGLLLTMAAAILVAGALRRPRAPDGSAELFVVRPDGERGGGGDRGRPGARRGGGGGEGGRPEARRGGAGGGETGRGGGAGEEGAARTPPPLPAPILRDRARKAVLAALLAMAVHGLVIAGEDLRHWWALLAVAGVMVGQESVAGRPDEVERADG